MINFLGMVAVIFGGVFIIISIGLFGFHPTGGSSETAYMINLLGFPAFIIGVFLLILDHFKTKEKRNFKNIVVASIIILILFLVIYYVFF